jgi:ankyrin repeat protein
MSDNKMAVMAAHPQKNLIEAIENGNISAVKALIIAHPALIHARTETSVPIVLYAAYLKKWDVVDELVDLGAELNIYEAAAIGDLDRAQQLLEQSPGQLNSYSTDGYTPLGLACYFGHTDLVQYLLDQGADVNKRSNNPMRVFPIHSAAAHDEPEVALSLVHMLLDYDANACVVQTGDYTALHQAAAQGNLGTVKLLVKNGCDPKQANADGILPLDLAEKHQHQNVVNFLNSL